MFRRSCSDNILRVACAPAEAGLAGSTVGVMAISARRRIRRPAAIRSPYCAVSRSPLTPAGPRARPTSSRRLRSTNTSQRHTSIVVSDNQITIANLVDPAQNNPLFCTTALPCHDVFDGLVFAFSGNNSITNVAVDPSTPNADFQPRSIAFDAHTIYVDLTGADPSSYGETLVLDVTAPGVTTTPGVPEPATWGLLLVGFAGLGWTGWRRTLRLRAA